MMITYWNPERRGNLAHVGIHLATMIASKLKSNIKPIVKPQPIKNHDYPLPIQ